MPTQVSQEVVPKTPEAHHNEILHRRANYHPSIWGDQFISHLPEDKVIACKKDNTMYIYNYVYIYIYIFFFFERCVYYLNVKV